MLLHGTVSSKPTATSMHVLSPLNPQWLLLKYALKAMPSSDPQKPGAEADAATFLAGLLRVIFDVENCFVLFSALMFALGTWKAMSLCMVPLSTAPQFANYCLDVTLQRPLCNTKRAPWLLWLVLSCPQNSSICPSSPLNACTQATNFISVLVTSLGGFVHAQGVPDFIWYRNVNFLLEKD